MKSVTVKTVVFLILLAALYHSSVSFLLYQWEGEDYNYCYLIPFITLYLIWEKHRQRASIAITPDWKGLMPLIFGILLFWLGELGGEYYTLYISMWLIVVGIIWMNTGWMKIKIFVFPIFFSLAMFPFPNFINNKFSFQLRLISSRIGVSFLNLYGMPAYREGNIIDLGFVQLQVVDACSGLRYLFPLFILSLLIAYFLKTNLWKRLFLVFSTIPLAIITNSLRIALTGVIYKSWGAEFAEGFFHGFSGWLIFTFCFFILMLEVWILNKIKFGWPDKLCIQSMLPDSGAPSDFDRTDPIQPPKVNYFSYQLIVGMLLITATALLSYNIEFRENVPVRKSFNSFPLSIDGWEGVLQSMDEQIIQSLDLSDYIIADYQDNQGSKINFYTAYYESQRKGESIHSPETCIPGSGWVFTDKGSIPVQCESGLAIHVNEAFIQKNNSKQVVYYWFPQRGRILTNAYQLKIFTFWDALTRQRTDGALVRLITPIMDGEKLIDAEIRLQSFICELLPILNEYIPN